MAAPLKDLYNDHFFEDFSGLLATQLGERPAKQFVKSIRGEQWEALSLKERMAHISDSLHLWLDLDYPEAAAWLEKFTEICIKDKGEGLSLLYMFLPHYVQTYGMEHPDISIPLLLQITRFSSAEFAIRPFISRYPGFTFDQLLKATGNSSAFIRRLASEGSRPRLPWGGLLPELIADPSLTLPVLEALKNDPAETVRKSVANHLNDISKDHPGLVVDILQSWEKNETVDKRMIRHALRTLLKQGDPDALAITGVRSDSSSSKVSFRLRHKNIHIGERLEMECSLHHTAKKAMPYRVDFFIDFLKKNGSTNRKVFRWKDLHMYPGTTTSIKKSFELAERSTRKLYPGKHIVGVQVNGKVAEELTFTLR